MRVLVDSNVFISYLLSAHGSGVIQNVFAALSDGKFDLLLPQALLDEIVTTVSNRPRLADRIDPVYLEEFIGLLKQLGTEVPRIEAPIPAATRDLKDDYLLAYALVGRADYLVTGDKDLLVLDGQVGELSIVTPRQFADLLIHVS